MTQHVRRDRPERLCDVVMKGGITSGVVYPRAVSELAGTFRLKNVGGTSAGAIAAAVAAAAEFGREDGGFDELDALPGWLAQKGNLEGLFQPQESTSELYRVLLAGVRHRGAARVVAVIAAAVYWFLPASLLGALPGAALIWQARGAIGIVLGAAVALVGMVIAAAVAVARRATTAIPANRFGLCSGMPGLTPWLTDRIDAAARRPQPQGPLTFGELWAGPGGDPATADPADGWLRLEMVTTNVTNHRAEQLPSASREFFFDPDELADLFPKAVVAWMVDHPPPLSTQPARRRDQQLRRRLVLPLLPMPHAADLPVIVATRMSL